MTRTFNVLDRVTWLNGKTREAGQIVDIHRDDWNETTYVIQPDENPSDRVELLGRDLEAE